MSLKYELLPHQADFVNSQSRFLLNSGGVGSGKTYSIVLKTLDLALRYEGIFILIGAQTYPLLRDTTLREFLNVIPKDLIAQYNKTEQHFWLINGSEVIFRPFDDENKLKSLNLGAAGIEEMTDVPEEVFKMLRTRLRQDGMPGCLYGATNPSTFGNWVYKYFIENPIRDSEIIYSISADNWFLPKEYLGDLEQIKISNPEYYERMVMGRWGALEGLVYNFPIELRVKKVPERKLLHRIVAGLDFGFTHPTAFTVIGYRDPAYYVIDEVYRHKITSGEIVAFVKEKMSQYGIEVVYCDGSRPEIIEDLRRAGIPAEPGIKDVFDGIMYVKSLIGRSELSISENCKYTLREMDSYIWDMKSLVKEQPLKVNDDCMDALRYALYSDFRKYGGDSMEIYDTGEREKWDW